MSKNKFPTDIPGTLEMLYATEAKMEEYTMGILSLRTKMKGLGLRRGRRCVYKWTYQEGR